MAHPTDTLGPRRQSRQAPSGNATGASYPPPPPPRTPLPSPPPWLSVPPARPIAEPPWRALSPAPATATVPDPRPRLTPGKSLRRRRRLFRRGASPTTIRWWHTTPRGVGTQVRTPVERSVVAEWDAPAPRAGHATTPPAPRPDPILVRKSGPAGDACASLFMVFRITE